MERYSTSNIPTIEFAPCQSISSMVTSEDCLPCFIGLSFLLIGVRSYMGVGKFCITYYNYGVTNLFKFQTLGNRFLSQRNGFLRLGNGLTWFEAPTPGSPQTSCSKIKNTLQKGENAAWRFEKIIKPQISPNGWAEDAKALIFRWFCGIDDAGIY